MCIIMFWIDNWHVNIINGTLIFTIREQSFHQLKKCNKINSFIIWTIKTQITLTLTISTREYFIRWILSSEFSIIWKRLTDIFSPSITNLKIKKIIIINSNTFCPGKTQNTIYMKSKPLFFFLLIRHLKVTKLQTESSFLINRDGR